MEHAYQTEGRESLRERFYQSKIAAADKVLTALHSSTQTLTMLFPNFDNEQSHLRLFQHSEIETMDTGVQLLQQISGRLDQLDEVLEEEISPSVATLQSALQQCKQSLSQYEQDTGFNNYSTKFAIYRTIYFEIKSLVASIEQLSSAAKRTVQQKKPTKRPRDDQPSFSETIPIKMRKKEVLNTLQQISLSLARETHQFDFQYPGSACPKGLSDEVWRNYYNEQTNRLESIFERKSNVVRKAIGDLNNLLQDEHPPETSLQIQEIISTLSRPIQPRPDKPKSYYPSFVLPSIELKHALTEMQCNLKEAGKLLTGTTGLLMEMDKPAVQPANMAN